MTKKNKFISIILSFCFMFVLLTGLVGCGKNKDDGNNKNNNETEISSGEVPSNPSNPLEPSNPDSPTTESVSAKEIVNQSLDQLEKSMSNISGNTSYSSQNNEKIYGVSAVIPNPHSDTFLTKVDALLAMSDIFQGQYQMQYLINYANTENGYNANMELGKVYRTAYGSPESTDPTVNIFNQYISAYKSSNGVVFQNDIKVVADMGNVSIDTYYQYYFVFNYDFENQKPLSMTLYVKQVTDQTINGVRSKELAMVMSKVDYVQNVIYQLNFAGEYEDMGAAVLEMIENNQFNSEKFIADSGIKGYLFEKVGLNLNENDFKIYNYKLVHGGESTQEIDQTFCDTYDEIYDALKNDMHSKDALVTNDAIDMGDLLYNNMYYYARQVLGNLDTTSGNIKVRTIKELSQMKSILEDLKLDFETNDKYNQTSGEFTYTKAKAFVDNAITYVSELKQGLWFSCLSTNKDDIVKYDSINNCYLIEYHENGAVRSIYFTIDQDNKASLYSDDASNVITTPDR